MVERRKRPTSASQYCVRGTDSLLYQREHSATRWDGALELGVNYVFKPPTVPFTPFPTLIPFKGISPCDVFAKPGKGSGDRSRDSLAVARIGTKYTKTLSATARRHTPTLRLGTAPQSPRYHSVIRGGSGDRFACSHATFP